MPITRKGISVLAAPPQTGSHPQYGMGVGDVGVTDCTILMCALCNQWLLGQFKRWTTRAFRTTRQRLSPSNCHGVCLPLWKIHFIHWAWIAKMLLLAMGTTEVQSHHINEICWSSFSFILIRCSFLLIILSKSPPLFASPFKNFWFDVLVAVPHLQVSVVPGRFL